MRDSLTAILKDKYPDLNKPYSSQEQAAIIDIAEAIDMLVNALLKSRENSR